MSEKKLLFLIKLDPSCQIKKTLQIPFQKNAKTHDWNRFYKSSISKTVFVDGKATVDFLMDDDLAIIKHLNPTVVLDVTFTDELSKTVRNASTEVRIYKRTVKIEIEKYSEKFKPSLPFRYNVKVNYRDGTPVLDDNNQVQVELFFDGIEKASNFHSLNEFGLVPLAMTVEKGVQNVSIKVGQTLNFYS
jgi:hypothetical protein